MRFLCAAPLALGLLLAGCASRPLPKYEKPLARARFQTVRTTAYTHTESDHLEYSNRNALGTRLQSGALNSASCDWSRWPVGTVFRIQETGQTYIVDDYGWALAGTNTIDLYQPTRQAMNAWGVRRVHLELLEWGDARRSLAILRPRSKHRHVRRMVDQLRDRYAELSRPADFSIASASGDNVMPTPAAESLDASDPAPRTVAIEPPPAAPTRAAGGFTPAEPSRVALRPFVSSAAR